MPREHDVDGLVLDRLRTGTVVEVSPTVGSWLIAEGYADPEMRQSAREEIDFSDRVKPARSTAHERTPRRRSTDRQ